MNAETLIVNACVAKLELSTSRITTCLGKLTNDQIWSRGSENENAVGNLVLHLAGNVRQWIGTGLGGQPDVRVRDEEFSTTEGMGADDLIALLKGTISAANQVIGSLTPNQLTHIYQIQTRTVSGVEALLGVVEHFGQHTGQIIYITKHLTGEDLAFFAPRKAGA